jgi:hypothetical protein
MFLKKSIIVLFIGISFVVKSQSFNNEFEKFAIKQDSLMIDAYNILDTSSYRNILNLLIIQYEKLDETNKQHFKSYIDNGYYNFACTYSLSRNNNLALINLEKSNWKDYYQLLSDNDLNSIRNENRFKILLKKAKDKTPDYLKTLRNDSKYNNSEICKIPPFTYTSYSDSNLIRLRKTYNLDSVAGRGNEISKFISLMRWVHNKIPHNGSYGNPDVKNAMSMISYCNKNNQTLNCRGLSIVLNEIYLSMGYQSRFVVCFPKDSSDSDCHVICIVYSKTLHKWIWMDPTFEAFVMNELGELLSIDEVRIRLIENKPLILNPDANWNHKSSYIKSYYLDYYMTKNLYRFQCPLHSKYNFETNSDEIKEYVELIPVNINSKQNSNKNLYKSYLTSNSSLFWKLP